MGAYVGHHSTAAIIGYLMALGLRELRERSYRQYVTDVLLGIGGGKGIRWVDIAYRDNEAQEKTADDIISDMIARGGLVPL